MSKRFSGHVPGVYSAAGVSRYMGAFGFSAARIVATFLHKLPTTTLRFPVEPVVVYRVAGMRPKS